MSASSILCTAVSRIMPYSQCDNSNYCWNMWSLSWWFLLEISTLLIFLLFIGRCYCGNMQQHYDDDQNRYKMSSYVFISPITLHLTQSHSCI